MKKLVFRFFGLWCLVIYFGCINGKQIDLLNVLFDDEVSIKPRIETKNTLEISDEEDSEAEAIGNVSLKPDNEEIEPDNEESQKNYEPSGQQSQCDLLDLLFADTQISKLFPDKNEKYYRGQFEVIGLKYIDNSVCDDQMPAAIRSKRAIDQERLSTEEQEVVEKYYRLTKQQFESPWYMKFISKKVGYGIYAGADIEPGQLIAEYVGIIYDEQSYLNKIPRNPKYCWNVLPVPCVQNGQKFYVDAIECCNFTRIINHSYKPNVIPVTMYGPDGSRMLYVACEKIKKDEQLLVNYGQGYWQNLGEPEELSR